MALEYTYVRARDGVILDYPYHPDKLRADNPNVSFPAHLTDEILKQFGVFAILYPEQPQYDPATQICIPDQPKWDGQQWFSTFSLMPATPEETEAWLAEKAAEVRSERDTLLAGCDWTQIADAPVDKAAWASYRKALRDVTAQAGFPRSVTWPIKPE